MTLVKDSMDFIETPVRKPGEKVAKAKPAPKAKAKVGVTPKGIWKIAKRDHKEQIKKLKAQRKQLKADIKKHKLLIKQARLTYKLSK